MSNWGWQHGTLIVIDYAASFAPELRFIFEELSQPDAAAHSARLRILLLERHASPDSGWYNTLISGSYGSAAVRDLFDPWEPISIQPLHAVPQRYEIFRGAIERAAPLQTPVRFCRSPSPSCKANSQRVLQIRNGPTR